MGNGDLSKRANINAQVRRVPVDTAPSLDARDRITLQDRASDTRSQNITSTPLTLTTSKLPFRASANAPHGTCLLESDRERELELERERERERERLTRSVSKRPRVVNCGTS
jgi:hypothetical protein